MQQPQLFHTDSYNQRQHARVQSRRRFFSPLLVFRNHFQPIRYFLARPRVPQVHRPTTLPMSNSSAGPRVEMFSFGVVSDIQYAQLSTLRTVTTLIAPDGRKTAIRRRRSWNETLMRLKEACVTFNKEDVDLVINLGDTIEGYLEEYDPSSQYAQADLIRTLHEFSALAMPCFHVIGNHCRSVPQKILLPTLQLAAFENGFYSYEPYPGWKLIFLNSAQVCGTAVDATPKDIEQIQEIVTKSGRHWERFHGALGKDQLQWLTNQLDDAKKAGQKVIISSHYPLADGAARRSHVLANTEDVRSIIERDGSPVLLCLAGHDHLGGILTVPANERRGTITYVTFPAMLEAPANGNAFSIIKAYSDGSFTINGGENSPVNSAIVTHAPLAKSE